MGCRKRELAVELIRVVASRQDIGAPGDVPAAVVDPAGSLAGRGAWLHPDPRCLSEAVRRRAFARALRITGSPDISAVVEYCNALGAPATEQVAKNMSTP